MIYTHILRIFIPFAVGYFISYFFRSINALIAPLLAVDLELDAAALGLLTSVYFLTFAAFQVPLGLLLDRFGPRRVHAALLLIAALGAAIFGYAEHSSTVLLGRALIGLGVSAGLMASFKAFTLWFPQRHWPLVNGCLLACGGLGAIASTKPAAILLDHLTWRSLFLWVALITLLAAALIFLVVPEKPSASRSTTSLKTLTRGLRSVFTDAFFWSLVPFALFSFGFGLAIHGLWAGPWLRDVALLPPERVAQNLLFLAIGVTTGMIGTGCFGSWIASKGWNLLHGLQIGAALFILLQLPIMAGLWASSPLIWIAFGLLSPIGTLGYPALASHFPLHLSGIAQTAYNLMVIGGAFLVQYAIGVIIGFWPSGADGTYQPAAYRWMFLIFIVLQGASLLWLRWGCSRRRALEGHASR